VTYEMEGARVRVHAPHIPGEEGEVLRYYPATEQYLVHITGTGCMVWISTSDAGVLG
jgi:hypothetical protein